MSLLDRLKKTFIRSKSIDDEDDDLVFDTTRTGFLNRMFGTDSISTQQMLEMYSRSLYVFACVWEIAKAVSAVDYKLMKVINRAGDTQELYEHPLLDILAKPNPYQTGTGLIQQSIINLKLTGDAILLKVRDNSGTPIELWNLRPDMVTIVKDPTLIIKAYKATINNVEYVFDPMDIIHWKMTNPLDEFRGMSPIKPAKSRIDTEYYASRYQRDFFLNHASPEGILSFEEGKDVVLSREHKEEIRERWEKRHRGVGKNNRIEILDANMKYQQVSLTQREMDYIESMRFTRDDILVAYHVPKAIVAITDDVNLANSRTAREIFASETVDPEAKALFEAISNGFEGEFDFDTYIEHIDPTPENRENLIKESTELVNSGIMSVNEARQKFDLPPIDGGWALYKPMNLIPIGEVPQKLRAVPVRDTRFKRFHGRDVLKAQMDIKQIIIDAEVVKAEKRADRKKLKEIEDSIVIKELSVDEPMVKTQSLFADRSQAKVYQDTVNKQIDGRSEVIIAPLNKFMEEQSKRVIAKLKERKGVKMSVSDIGLILDKAGETERVASFVLPFLTEWVKDAGIEAYGLLGINQDFSFDGAIESAVIKRARELSKQINDTTFENISTTLAEGINEGESITKLSKRIKDVYDDFSAYRTRLIARTEATVANNQGFMSAYKQSGIVTHKEWIATADDRTREEHAAMDGEIVPIDKPFSNGLQYPQEPNCRCTISAAFTK